MEKMEELKPCKSLRNKTIRDGGVAPRYSFIGSTKILTPTREHIDPHCKHKCKKGSGTQKGGSSGAYKASRM